MVDSVIRKEDGVDVLPPLREDLQLHVAPFADGMPTWNIYDPSMHRYIRIGWSEFEILSRWGLGNAQAISDSINKETTLETTDQTIKEFAIFAQKAFLLKIFKSSDTERMMLRMDAGKHSLPKWLLHNYLFLRLKLVDPDRFLTWSFPFVSWMFSKVFLILLSCSALLGFFLVTRQWEKFTHSLVDMFNLEGAILVGIALSFSKLIHELGHGYAAKKLGCRVPSMGVAFLVMWPVLWTDVTDAWKLVKKQDRLLIDASGMLAEITLATIATLLWSVLDDGGLKSASFILASSTWILTLVVNLSPLMRFDGYFILSDMFGIPNLQERGFAIARWWLRKQITGNNISPPEYTSRSRLCFMLLYSYSTWIYRFGLFLGIAILVYHMAFKALGFFLMGVEIYFFLLGPIIREIIAIGKTAMQTGFTSRLMVSLTILTIIIAACIVPWTTHVHAPALAKSNYQTVIYSSEPGNLIKISHEGDIISKNAVMFQLSSYEVKHDKDIATARLNSIIADLQNQTFDPQKRSNISTTAQEKIKVASELAVSLAKENSLIIKAPFTGTLVDIPTHIKLDNNIPRKEPLGTLVDVHSMIIEAYVNEEDLGRLKIGERGKFFPLDGEDVVELKITNIASVSERNMDIPELSSANSGPILVRKDTASGQSNKVVPESAIYRVTLMPIKSENTIIRRIRGMVVINADNQSIISRIWQKSLAIFIRETGL